MLYTDEAIKKRKRRANRIKNIINIVVYMFLVPLLIYNVTLIAQAVINPNETPSFFGIKTYVIISGSMQPKLEIGDIVIVKKVKAEELQIGDIISFRQGESVITHRITNIVIQNGETQYKTKGDNNNAEDSGTISQDIIEGKVVKSVPILGKLALLLQHKIFILFIMIIAYLYLSYSGANKKRKLNRKKKRIEYEKRKTRKQHNE